MTARQMAFCWIGALLMLAGLIGGPRWLMPGAPAMPRADVYVIGSSLMAHGFPARGSGKASPFGAGRSFYRIAAIRMDEGAALDWLERALEQRPDAVLIEGNMFLFDFANRANQRACDGAVLRLRHAIWRERIAVIDQYRALVGAGPYGHYRREPTTLDAPHSVNRADMDLLYPLVLRKPCDTERLQQLAARAKRQGTRLVLVLPPRAPVAQARLGQLMVADLTRNARQLAAQAGLELYQPVSSFADAHFVDHAHLNRTGRQRFLADLQHWWQGAP